jgi:hypothetical protein
MRASDSPSKHDPRLAAVEAELSSDRGEIPDPEVYRQPDVQYIPSMTEDFGALIASASAAEKMHGRRKRKRLRFSWELVLRILTLGIWRPKAPPPKDYTYEFDPKTGGQRRVYLVDDGKR